VINVISDMKHGLRVLLRTPLFTICTITALAIGIGSTTALFSVVHALLMKPLPYPNAESLVVIWEHNLPRNRARNVVSPANFLARKERSRSFQGMATFTQSRVTLTGTGEPQELAAIVMSADMLNVLGVRPVAGGARAVRCCRRSVADRLRQHRQPGADARVRARPRSRSVRPWAPAPGGY